MSAADLPAGYHREGSVAVKYELAFSPDTAEATIIRSVYAGVSGPHGHAEDITTREQAEAYAFAQGLIAAAPWTVAPIGTHYRAMTSFKG